MLAWAKTEPIIVFNLFCQSVVRTKGNDYCNKFYCRRKSSNLTLLIEKNVNIIQNQQRVFSIANIIDTADNNLSSRQ